MLALGKEGCIWVNFSDSFSLMHMCCFSLLTFSTFSFPITCFPLYFSLYLSPFFLNIPFCTSIFIFIFFLSIWGLICVPFSFLFFSTNYYHPIYFNQSCHFSTQHSALEIYFGSNKWYQEKVFVYIKWFRTK